MGGEVLQYELYFGPPPPLKSDGRLAFATSKNEALTIADGRRQFSGQRLSLHPIVVKSEESCREWQVEAKEGVYVWLEAEELDAAEWEFIVRRKPGYGASIVSLNYNSRMTGGNQVGVKSGERRVSGCEEG